MRIGTDPPIAGAEVFLDEVLVGLTGADGSLAIAEVAAGSHTIRAHKNGYEDASATISVPETTSVTLTLSPVPPIKINTEIRLSSDKTTYTVGETAHITQGLYDEAGNLVSGRVVDYTATLNGAWYAGWGQYSDDPSRTLILNKAGTYTITGEFAGDETYGPSSKSITITATRKETRADVWVRDLIPNQTARVCVLLEALVDGAWQPLPEKTVDVVVYDPDGAWHAGWGEYTGTSWACRGFIANRSGTWTFVVSFAGDDEYLPCSYTREVTAEAATHTVVVSIEGSGPIAGALVLFDHLVKGYTDSAGSITITDVTAGAHLVEARKDGYYDASATIDVPVTTSVTLTMTPIPEIYDIYVHVTGSMHGIIVDLPDRPVYLDGALVGHTDSRGDLYITDVAEGTHSVRVVAPTGWQPLEDTKSVIVPDGSVSFYFWFAPTPPTYTVSVMVRYMAWPKSGASVYMDGVFKGVTDYLGKLSVPDVAAGSHTFRAEWLNYWDEETITVPVNTVTLELHI